jgi:hypothetical protein
LGDGFCQPGGHGEVERPFSRILHHAGQFHFLCHHQGIPLILVRAGIVKIDIAAGLKRQCAPVIDPKAVTVSDKEVVEKPIVATADSNC